MCVYFFLRAARNLSGNTEKRVVYANVRRNSARRREGGGRKVSDRTDMFVLANISHFLLGHFFEFFQ